MNRRQFIQTTAMIASTTAVAPSLWAVGNSFPVVRIPKAKRKFISPAVEKTIAQIQASIGNCYALF
ncbi:MAG: hypothetical protein ACREC8_04760 [Limisphaerales bacterium]